MSSDDESTTARPEHRYQLRSDPRPFVPLSLSSRPSRRYGQASTTPPSSSATPTRGSGSTSGSGYTSTGAFQSPFGGLNQRSSVAGGPVFSSPSYPPLQAAPPSHTYTMEVSSSSGRIEKFSGRPGTISLREFKATFSTVVCELELKYGANFTNAFAFKQLARYVHYEALDVYEQHSQRILGITQIPNPAYAAAIATASQAALQAAIVQHGSVPNNPAPPPTSVALTPQELDAATANVTPTIGSSTFADPVGEFFRVLELEFPVKSSEKILQLATFSRQKDETLKMLYRRLLKLKEDTQSITDLEAAHRYLRSLEGNPTLHSQVLQRVFSEFGDSYTLLDVYTISEKLELAHAYYDARNMRPYTRSRPQQPPAATTRSPHTSSRSKPAHFAAPILPSCNYCGNPDHKANECNIP